MRIDYVVDGRWKAKSAWMRVPLFCLRTNMQATALTRHKLFVMFGQIAPIWEIEVI